MLLEYKVKKTQEHQIQSFVFHNLKDWKRIKQGLPSFLCYWITMASVPPMVFQPICWDTQVRARADLPATQSPICWVGDEGTGGSDEGEPEWSQGDPGWAVAVICGRVEGRTTVVIP